MIKHAKGFTLVEVLVALAVFAVLATITGTAMYHAFNTKARLAIQSTRLMNLQLALTRMKHDINLMINRPVRSNQMRLLSAFIGQKNYIEFTRTGIANPQSIQKISSLQRIAWLCAPPELIRRTWMQVDSIDHNKFQDQVILTELKQCEFDFYNKHRQQLSEWHDNIAGQAAEEPLPAAIKLSFININWGRLTQLFLQPKALYVTTRD